MPKKRGNKNFVAIPIEGQTALGALADGTLVAVNVMTGEFTEDFYAISADIDTFVRALTASEGTPSSWGLAHGDYTVAEIDENLELSLLGPGSKIEQEQARRLVRKGSQFKFNNVVNDELIPTKTQRVKLKFVVQSGQHLDIWFKNRSGSVLTTGAIFEWSGTLYGRWIL